MPRGTFDDSLDFKFIDPTNFADADDAGVTNARKQQLVNEALNVAVNAWIVQKASDNDNARADAMGVIPPPPDDPEAPDPNEDARAKQEALRAGAAAAQEQANQLQDSFKRKRARLAAGQVTITTTQVKDAKKQFLVGSTDANGNPTGGYLQQLENEFASHRARRQRAVKALALTGALALNDQEAADMQQQIQESENAMDVIRSIIAVHRQELVNLGGTLPARPAGAEEPTQPNRATRRAKK